MGRIRFLSVGEGGGLLPPPNYMTYIPKKTICAFCGEIANYSAIQGVNGDFFHCCPRCSKKFKKEPYEHREKVLGILPKIIKPTDYCTKHLEDWIRYHSWKYYQSDQEVSDAEWDKSFRELQKREKICGASSNSPTTTVGSQREEVKRPNIKGCKDCEEGQESKKKAETKEKSGEEKPATGS